MNRLCLNSIANVARLHQPCQFRRARLASVLIIACCAFLLPYFVVGQDELPSALSGFESSELYEFRDNQPIAPTNEHLIRLLFRAKKSTPKFLRRYSRFTQGTKLVEIIENPQKHRVQVFRFKGQIKGYQTYRLPAQYADSEIEGFKIARVISDEGIEMVVAAQSIPKAWAIGKTIDQPIEFFGFFQSLVNFNSGDANRIGQKLNVGSNSTPLFVTDRIGWFPTKTDMALHVGTSQVLLASNGVDIGQFDFVRANNNAPISTKDADCFLQMLAATHGMPGNRLNSETLNFQELLRKKDKRFGDAVRFEGHVRRAVRLYIDRKDVREKLGIDHYYELDMFIPLGKTRIAFTSRPSGDPDAEPIETVYQNRFPATVCVTSLPCSTQEIRGKRIVVEGFFFKFWNYESEFTSRIHPDLGQISPLVIGLQPTVNSTSGSLIDNFLFVGVGAFAFGAVLMIWVYQRSDRANANPILRTKAELPDRIDL